MARSAGGGGSEVKSYRAAILAVLIALPSLMAAITGYIEARTKAMELQALADNYGDYIREVMREGCNP